MPSKSEVKILPRRFDLIKKMYLSDKVIAINKKDQIFNWFFEQFEKFQSESYTYELLWKTFHEILEIEKQQTTGHRILIKSNAVRILSNTLKHYPFSSSWASVILSSIAALLEIPRLNTVLIADVDNMFTLLIDTLKILNKMYECNYTDLSTLEKAKYLAKIILDVLENLPSANEEVKALLLADSLQDLAIFMHIASNDEKLEMLKEKLANKIISILFNLKKKSYETLLTQPDPQNLPERPNSHLRKFFSLLQELLQNEDVIVYSVPVMKACGTLIKKLLSTFLLQNNSLHSLKVISLFFAVAGLDIPILFTANSCCNSLFKVKRKNPDATILGISYLLEGCLTVPQYFTSFIVPEGYVRPSLWLRGVSTALLDIKVSKNKAAWLKCLCSLLKITPSMVEQDIVLLIKNALLNISLHGKDSKKQYCELFDVILQTHSKLHQVPKFFVKFLLALTQCMKENLGGNLLINGQILPQVQKSIAKCIQELPYRQMVDLWEIFVETFSTLENMSQVFMVSRGFIFYVAQLFSIFLLQAPLFQVNVPSNISSLFETLIENTDLEIKKNISTLKETDSKILPLKSSVLLLYFAIGEVKLLYNYNHGKFPDASEIQKCVQTFDFSILHPALDEHYSSILEACVNSDNKIISLLVFQLVLQKIRVLDFCMKFNQSEDSSTSVDVIHIKNLIPVVLTCLEEGLRAFESWDEDLCTVNTKNYGTAYWMTFLKMAPLVLDYFDSQNMYLFCSLAQDILFQDAWSETRANHPIYSALKNGYFEEFKPFQTAFVSAMWRKDNIIDDGKRDNGDVVTEERPVNTILALLNSFSSKSVKYAQRTPKSNKSLGSMWNEIKEVTDFLNEILSSGSLPSDKFHIERIRSVLDLFRTLPLQYLLPGNQMKSIVGLSLFFFLTPQSCKHNEAVILCKEISQQLLAIFDGARSIWLFDYIKSGPYLKFVVKTIESVIDEGEEDLDWAVLLLEHMITLIVKNIQSLNDLESYISDLGAEKKYSKSSLITLYALLKKLLQVLTNPHKQQKYEETVVKISLLALQGFMKQMKKYLKEDMKNVNFCYYIKCYTVAVEIVSYFSEAEKLKKDCFELLPVVLDSGLEDVKNAKVSRLGDEYILFISKICKYTSKLSEHLPGNFVEISWEIILSHLNVKMTKHLETYQSLKITSVDSVSGSNIKTCRRCSLPLLETHCYENNENFESCKYDKDNLLMPFVISELEEECLKELSKVTSVEILSENFQSLLKEMGSFNSTDKDMFVLQKSIAIFNSIIDANNDKLSQPVFQNNVQKILLLLQGIANQACNSYICQIMIMIPILEFIDFIVKGNKGLPKQVLLQTLHCVVPVPLEVYDENYELFVKLFSASWQVVYDLFMHHTPFITSSPTAFLYYVAKLLKSIVKAGAAEPLSRCNTSIRQQVQLCAQNMNRLLTVISRNKNDFAKLVPYLIADYVDTVQHITLDQNIKESILAGIHRLLDICHDHSVKMIAVNINYVCREIYSNLVKNYRQDKRLSSA